MRIVVGSSFEAGSALAHAINTVKTAEGFARLGHDVHLVCRRPASGALDEEALARVYGLSARLRWHQVRPRLGARVLDAHWHFALQALPIVLALRPDLVFSRSFVLPSATAALGIATISESHAWPDNASAPLARMVAGARRKAYRGLVTIAPTLAESFAARGVPQEKILVLPDAVDLDLFAPKGARPRSQTDGVRRVVYAGHLYDYKGIPTVLAAAERLPAVRFELVGGLPDDVARCARIVSERGLRNVVLHGLKPLGAVPAHLWDADALILPPSADHPSAAWTSPVKLGEYLAAQRPVVASEIPALRHWLNDREAAFFAPDDAADCARVISQVLDDPDYAQALAAAGARLAPALAYERRAEAILAFAEDGTRPPDLSAQARAAAAVARTKDAFAAAISRLGPGDIAVDCGANVGEYTEAMARTGATVHAFEPNPHAFAALERRVAGLPNVHLHRAAVDATAGTALLFQHVKAAEDPLYWSQGASLVSEKANVDARNALEVETVDLAAFVEALERPPALVKIDIEGAEGRVLDRLVASGLMARLPAIFVETHERKIPALRPALARLDLRRHRDFSDKLWLDWE
jgi:FkbM family methyltransferase